ncbi:MAG TPA: molybdopterin molybdotransferase MoeA [Bacteroidia bacterium]|nr:molybdopterin molybdotransferase MoeA [Bacteroidia bacterium]
MITFKEAKQIVFEQQISIASEKISIHACIGRTLFKTIVADRDLPPFDRVTMDGIAINYLDLEKNIKEWLCVKTQFAGETAVTILEQGICVEVMTGAVLPKGCDTVIRYEDLLLIENENGERRFKLNEVVVKKSQNIHFKGSDKKAGEVVLKGGQVLNATDIALLASVGEAVVEVHKKTRIVIISTGDELVSHEQTPNDFQIRASNQMMISTSLKELGIESDHYLVRDEFYLLEDILKKCIQQYDIIVLTGAVSKGKADHIPDVLNSLEVECLFHGVAQRPAKPFWFGKKNNVLVFAMPGNPVSAAVCSYVYLLPFLKKEMNFTSYQLKVKLEEEIFFKPKLTYFMQVKVYQNTSGEFIAKPFQGNGSGDLTNLAEINAFVLLPMEDEKFETTKYYTAYLTRNLF